MLLGKRRLQLILYRKLHFKKVLFFEHFYLKVTLWNDCQNNPLPSSSPFFIGTNLLLFQTHDSAGSPPWEASACGDGYSRGHHLYRDPGPLWESADLPLTHRPAHQRQEVQERVNNEAMGSRNVQKRMIKKQQKVKLIKRTDYLSGNMYREIQWEGMKAVKEYKAFKQKKIKIVDLWGIGS